MTAVNRIKDFVSARSLGDLYYNPPVLAGLVGLFVFGGSLEASLINRVAGRPAGSVGVENGSPVVDPVVKARSIILGPGGAINSLLPDTADYSIVTVARAHPTEAKIFASTLNGSTTTTGYGYVGSRVTDGRIYQGSLINGAVASPNAGSATSPTDERFRFVAATCDSDPSGTVLKEYVPSVLNVPRSDTFAGQRSLLSNSPWWFGCGANQGTLPGNTELAMMLVYNRAITSNEVDDTYAYTAEDWFADSLGNAL